MPKTNIAEKKMKKYNLAVTGNGYKITMDFGNIGEKIDIAQLVLDQQVWQDMQRYMPMDTNTLISDTNKLNTGIAGTGKVYAYPPTNPYGHYQYEGIVYKDPVYNFAGLYDPDRGWFSRRGVKKVPSTQLLKYSQPLAKRHWAEEAIKRHGNEWVDLVRRTLNT